ncbi:MAG: acyltransferase [Planctomycetia bacterium]|nr:acyltransferase [Planctomycetia bacterium]
MRGGRGTAISGRNLNLDFLRILMAFSVVVQHFTANVYQYDHGGSNLVAMFAFLFTGPAVPVFVMISGVFILSPGYHCTSLMSFYRKRMSVILVPLLFWWVVYAGRRWIWYDPQCTPELIKLIVLTPVQTALWYLLMCISLYFFAPFLRKALMELSRPESYILMAAALVISGVVVFHGRGYFDAFSRVFVLYSFPFIL